MSSPSSELSPAQLVANKANAQLSSGPRTEAGKAVSRFNARRHGLTGQFYCMSAQDQEAYDAFEASFLHDLKPVGHYESQVAISIIQDYWRLNRSRATEANIYGRGHDRRAELTDAPTENTHAAAVMADTHRDDHRIFANIALYETRIHRMIVKNEKRLIELQTERKAAEAAARKEAELLVQLADCSHETPDQPETHSPTRSSTDVIEVNGFGFSIAEVRATLRRNQLLAAARERAKAGWPPAPATPHLKDLNLAA